MKANTKKWWPIALVIVLIVALAVTITWAVADEDQPKAPAVTTTSQAPITTTVDAVGDPTAAARTPRDAWSTNRDQIPTLRACATLAAYRVCRTILDVMAQNWNVISGEHPRLTTSGTYLRWAAAYDTYKSEGCDDPSSDRNESCHQAVRQMAIWTEFLVGDIGTEKGWA